MSGKRVLVTSGPTRGYVDAVRYLTNRSTGALGSLMATEALRRGAEVTFVYGRGSVIPNSHGLSEVSLSRLSTVQIETVEDLLRVLRDELLKRSYDVVIHAMAVLDYAPQAPLREKVPSGSDDWVIRLVKTPKVIAAIKELAPEVFLVGFKLEVGKKREELVERARRALKCHKADLFVANDLTQIERGEHIGYIVDTRGEVLGEGRGKEEIAEKLLGIVEEKMSKKREGGSDA